tara:strand:+ start:475 stop:675 length:201 start_codon:yes stop_codon:yes gene_type:complete
MNFKYYIFLVVCFVLFQQLKVFGMIDKTLKLKNKELAFGAQALVFFVFTELVRPIVNDFVSLEDDY